MAGSRNRARILELAGKALGMAIMDTVPDQGLAAAATAAR